ncbi:MAG: hypothetical protein J3Q66DRAFT_371461 [Benniella sp.]|nr:MAG: hypothetical protein J3Q66DRAFT_371461 [Benniella sp.]
MEDDSEGGLDYEDGLSDEGVLDDGEVLDELEGPNDKDPVTPIKTCPTDKPDHITVFAYGAAGSGVGSRIGGHLRWGGNWMRQELLRQGLVVALTDEYCTSKTCVYCFERLKLQKSRRLVGTEIKTKTVHGSVVCVNPECPAVQAGYATRPRDTNAAVGILLSAASVMLNEDEDAAPWPLLPYSRHARPRGVPTINTGAQDPENEQTSHEQMGDTSAIVDTAGQGQTTRVAPTV